MKIRVEQRDFAATAKWASRQLPDKPAVPALACLLLEADGEHLRISGFDYDTSTVSRVEAEVITPGRVLVSGRLLGDVAASMTAGPIDLVADDQTLTATAPGTRFSLPLAELRDYPSLPTPPAVSGTVDGAVFAQAVTDVAPSVMSAKDAVGSVQAMGGICLTVEGERLILAATDRYRFAVRTLSWQPAGPVDGSIVMPVDVLRSAARVLSGAEQISLSIPPNYAGTAGFGTDALTVTTRLIEGNYPPVGTLRPKPESATGSITFDPDELAAAAKRVALVSDPDAPVRLTVHGEVATLAGGSAGPTGSSDIAITADGDLDGFAIAFSPTFLASLLTPIDGAARMWLWTKTKPVLIEPEGEGAGYWALLMPIRLPN